ncbi:hypothetical protein [Saprospira grandis]|uniref:hypothetical protein n=1 Tax=Saprospira grandis TaxID=1008 RepID=UPI0022DE92A8|nr:hypothetical protein [Saprospira grandis]WBM74920.1 hypothetical protein OP864_01515 [Saprospira grandis]
MLNLKRVASVVALSIPFFLFFGCSSSPSIKGVVKRMTICHDFRNLPNSDCNIVFILIDIEAVDFPEEEIILSYPFGQANCRDSVLLAENLRIKVKDKLYPLSSLKGGEAAELLTKAENVFSVMFTDSLMSPPHSLEVFSNYYKTVFDDGFEIILDRGQRRKPDYLSIVCEKIPDFQYQVLEDSSGWKAVFEHSSEFDYSPFAPATIK